MSANSFDFSDLGLAQRGFVVCPLYSVQHRFVVAVHHTVFAEECEKVKKGVWCLLI